MVIEKKCRGEVRFKFSLVIFVLDRHSYPRYDGPTWDMTDMEDSYAQAWALYAHCPHPLSQSEGPESGEESGCRKGTISLHNTTI